jgi:hypothetical protein
LLDDIIQLFYYLFIFLIIFIHCKRLVSSSPSGLQIESVHHKSTFWIDSFLPSTEMMSAKINGTYSVEMRGSAVALVVADGISLNSVGDVIRQSVRSVGKHLQEVPCRTTVWRFLVEARLAALALICELIHKSPRWG